MKVKSGFNTDWTVLLLSIYIEASLFRATCFPLMYHGDNWKERLDEEMKIVGKNFEEITKAIENKFKGSKVQEQILNGLVPITTAIDTIKWNQFDHFGFEEVFILLNKFAKLGDLIPKMNLNISLTLLKDMFNDNRYADLTIEYELSKIRDHFMYSEPIYQLYERLLNIENEIIKGEIQYFHPKQNRSLEKCFRIVH